MATIAPSQDNTVQGADGSSQGTRPPGYQARGASTQFDRTKYTIGQASYPEDLTTSSQYGGNFVVFYINVHQDSMLLSGEGAAPTVSGNLTPRQTGELRGRNFSEGTLNTGLGAATGAAVYGAGLGSRAANAGLNAAGRVGAAPKSAVKEVVSAVGTVADAALAVGAAGVAVKTLGGANKEYKQLAQTIALHMPTDLAIRYGMQWDETTLAGTTALLAIAEGLGGAVRDSNGMTIPGVGSTVANYGVSQALRTPGIGEAISKTSGTAANPKKEQLFKQVDFRTFSYTYQFFPKSAEESRNVQNIIRLFKLHMHPEFKQDSANFMYLYPSEFDIFYYHNGKENLNIHRHTSCVLTDMSIMYSPQGVFTSFPDGSPTQINMTLTFKELGILTKENIQDGF